MELLGKKVRLYSGQSQTNEITPLQAKTSPMGWGVHCTSSVAMAKAWRNLQLNGPAVYVLDGELLNPPSEEEEGTSVQRKYMSAALIEAYGYERAIEDLKDHLNGFVGDDASRMALEMQINDLTKYALADVRLALGSISELCPPPDNKTFIDLSLPMKDQNEEVLNALDDAGIEYDLSVVGVEFYQDLVREINSGEVASEDLSTHLKNNAGITDAEELTSRYLASARISGMYLDGEYLLFADSSKVANVVSVSPEAQALKEQFYSSLRIDVANALPATGGIDAGALSFMLRENPESFGIKLSELDDSGLIPWLEIQDGNKLTKEDVLSYLDDQFLEFDIKFLYGKTEYQSSLEKAIEEFEGRIKELPSWQASKINVEEITLSLVNGEAGMARTLWAGNAEIEDLAERVMQAYKNRSMAELGRDSAVYEGILAEGNNYREMLITLPNIDSSIEGNKFIAASKVVSSAEVSNAIDRIVSEEFPEDSDEMRVGLRDLIENKIVALGNSSDLTSEQSKIDYQYLNNIFGEDGALKVMREFRAEQFSLNKRPHQNRTSLWKQGNIVFSAVLTDELTHDGSKALNVQALYSDWYKEGVYQDGAKQISIEDVIVTEEGINHWVFEVPGSIKQIVRKSDFYGDASRPNVNWALHDFVDRYQSVNEEINHTAPFKLESDWGSFCSKLILKYAAGRGYDTVNLPSGEVAAKRISELGVIAALDAKEAVKEKAVSVFDHLIPDSIKKFLPSVVNDPNDIEVTVGPSGLSVGLNEAIRNELAHPVPLFRVGSTWSEIIETLPDEAEPEVYKALIRQVMTRAESERGMQWLDMLAGNGQRRVSLSDLNSLMTLQVVRGELEFDSETYQDKQRIYFTSSVSGANGADRLVYAHADLVFTETASGREMEVVNIASPWECSTVNDRIVNPSKFFDSLQDSSLTERMAYWYGRVMNDEVPATQGAVLQVDGNRFDVILEGKVVDQKEDELSAQMSLATQLWKRDPLVQEVSMLGEMSKANNIGGAFQSSWEWTVIKSLSEVVVEEDVSTLTFDIDKLSQEVNVTADVITWTKHDDSTIEINGINPESGLVARYSSVESAKELKEILGGEVAERILSGDSILDRDTNESLFESNFCDADGIIVIPGLRLKSKNTSLENLHSHIDSEYGFCDDSSITLSGKRHEYRSAVPLLRINDGLSSVKFNALEISEIIKPMVAEVGVSANVVDSPEDLPERIRQFLVQTGAEKTTRGLIDPMSGLPYIIASNITSEKDAVLTYIHELVGHQGFMAACDDLNDTLGSIYRSMPTSEILRITKRYDSQIKGLKESDAQNHIALEWVAEISETRPQNTFVQTVAAKVLGWVRKIYPEMPFKKIEIVDLFGKGEKIMQSRELSAPKINIVTESFDKTPACNLYMSRVDRRKVGTNNISERRFGNILEKHVPEGYSHTVISSDKMGGWNDVVNSAVLFKDGRQIGDVTICKSGDDHFVDVSALSSPRLMSSLYESAFLWAHNNNIKLVQSPAGISRAQAISQCSAAIEVACKVNSTQFINPAAELFAGIVDRAENELSSSKKESLLDLDRFIESETSSKQNLEKIKEKSFDTLGPDGCEQYKTFAHNLEGLLRSSSNLIINDHPELSELKVTNTNELVNIRDEAVDVTQLASAIGGSLSEDEIIRAVLIKGCSDIPSVEKQASAIERVKNNGQRNHKVSAAINNDDGPSPSM